MSSSLKQTSELSKYSTPSPEKDLRSERDSKTDKDDKIKSQNSREDSGNSISLLAGLEEFLENSAATSEVFLLSYRGSSEVDRHYTKSMLPWIIAEIKNQNKFEKVKAEISQGQVTVRSFVSDSLVLSHSVKQIHKCVIEQADHTHFLYTLKPVADGQVNQQPELYQVPVPSNTSSSTDHQCHLFKAETEQDVRNFFRCLRQQPRDAHQVFRANSQMSCRSLTDLFLHNDSQFYEVLFVGRVKVSHAKVPDTFIDEACEAFRNKQKARPRNSTTEHKSSLASYQKEGSGSSVPTVAQLAGDSSSRSRSNSRDFGKATALRGLEEADENSSCQRQAALSGGDTTASPPPLPQQRMPPPRSTPSVGVPVPVAPTHGILHSPEQPSSPDRSSGRVSFDPKILAQPGSGWGDQGAGGFPTSRMSLERLLARRCSDQFAADSPLGGPGSPMYGQFSLTRAATASAVSPPSLFTALSLTAPQGGDEAEEGEVAEEGEASFAQPFRQRLRTISGGSSPIKLKRAQFSEPAMRARTGSIGSLMTRPRVLRQMSEAELKLASGCEFNRTMLFHIGREELQLINPEYKTVQLHKSFKDVPQRCQGIINNDHFGFICREVAGELPVYVGYVFRCDNADVTSEIVQSLNKSFNSVHSAHQKEKQENAMCEACPMKWFSSLCSEVEGLPAVRAHTVILRRVGQLPEQDRDLLLAKYEGADAPEVHRKNNVLMALLRAHLESQQLRHVHPGPGEQKGAESSLNRVKKSLATSFQQLLKRETSSADEGGGDRANRAASPHSKVRLENVSASSLSKVLSPIQRPRSSTVSAAGGDSMRREFRAKMLRGAAGADQMGVLKPNNGDSVHSDIQRQQKLSLQTGPVRGAAQQQKEQLGSGAGGAAAEGGGGDGGSSSSSSSSSSNSSSSRGSDTYGGITTSVTGYEQTVPITTKINEDESQLQQENKENNELPQQLQGQSSLPPATSGGADGGGGGGERKYGVAKMTQEVEAEVFGGVKPTTLAASSTKPPAGVVVGRGAADRDVDDDDEENIPQHKLSRPKMDIFLKIGSPSGPRDLSPSDDERGDRPSPAPSFRHAILQRVITPVKPDGASPSPADSSQAGAAPASKAAAKAGARHKRSWRELRLLWRRAVFRQMLLSRMEREMRIRRALEEEEELQRVCLSYEEEPVGEEALQTWQLVLSRPTARVDYAILGAGIRHGVPKALRGEIWHLLVSQHRAHHRLPPSTPESFHRPYEHMIKGLTSQQHAILIDLGRTFPGHPYFNRTLGPGQLGLFNLLKAYSLLDSEVGYCQGLSFVAGILLMHVNEEVAYQLLKHLMYVAGVRRQFRQDLDGLQVQMYQLSRLLHDHLKPVYLHLEANDISPQLYAAPWFLTLFASTFPLHFVVRLYDLLFVEGLEAVFRIGLVLLTEHQDGLLACDGFEETMDYLKTVLPDVPVDGVEPLFEMAFEMSLGEQLAAYEVEYQVLREELSVTPPQHQANVSKLAEEKRALKRQNLDLVEQLQNMTAQKQALEASNQMLLQSQHHLEVRVRFLEVERNNLKQVVTLLWRAVMEAGVDASSKLPSGLLRYLPTHSSSPQPLDRRDLVARINSEGSTTPRRAGGELLGVEGRSATVTYLGDAPCSDGGGDRGRQSFSSSSGRQRTIPHAEAAAALSSASRRQSPSPDPGHFGCRASSSTATTTTTTTTTTTSNNRGVYSTTTTSGGGNNIGSSINSSRAAAKPESGDSLFPPFTLPSLNFSSVLGDSSSSGGSGPHRARSSTLDHGSMQRFVRGLTRNN